MAKINFDASQHEARQPMEALPAGWYKVAVTNSEMKPTEKGDGAFLELEHTIIEGKFKNRKLFDRLNLKNINPQAVEIAQQSLAGLCQATGVIRCEDSEQLHNIPVFVKVSIEAKRTQDKLKNTINPQTKQPYKEGDPGTDTYEAKNRLQGYKNINDVPSSYKPEGDAAPAGSAATGGPAPAWANQKAATPGPKKEEKSAAPETTSSATPPWEKKKVEEPAKEETTKPKGPKGPKGKAAKEEAAPAVEPKFYVYFADDNMPVHSQSEIVAMLAKGMPGDTQILPEAEIKADEPNWVDASTLSAPAKEEKKAPVGDVPPWERKK